MHPKLPPTPGGAGANTGPPYSCTRDFLFMTHNTVFQSESVTFRPLMTKNCLTQYLER